MDVYMEILLGSSFIRVKGYAIRRFYGIYLSTIRQRKRKIQYTNRLP